MSGSEILDIFLMLLVTQMARDGLIVVMRVSHISSTEVLIEPSVATGPQLTRLSLTGHFLRTGRFSIMQNEVSNWALEMHPLRLLNTSSLISQSAAIFIRSRYPGPVSHRCRATRSLRPWWSRSRCETSWTQTPTSSSTGVRATKAGET